MSLVAACIGACGAAGVLLVLSGLRPGAVVQPPAPIRAGAQGSMLQTRRVTCAAALALPVAVLTRWPVAAAGLAALGWFSPELFGSKVARDKATARTEAVATWTEMLRDTMSGAHGLEEAVIITAAAPPAPIEAEVRALAARLEQEPLSTALRSFADELAHPTADLVVTALTLAAAGSAGELGDLLGTLAVAARDEAGMRLRVEAARARMRTSVRVIAACTAATAGGLVVLNPSYVEVYGTPLGQSVLAMVAGAWGFALWWLSRMSDFVAPERFLAGTAGMGDEVI